MRVKKGLVFIAILLVAIMSSFVLVSCKPPTVDDDKFLNYSGFQKAPENNVENSEVVDFSKNPLEVYNDAYKYTESYRKNALIVLTNTNIEGIDENTKGLDVGVRSSYFSAKHGANEFVQVVSGPSRLKLPDFADVSSIASKFGYVQQNIHLDGDYYARGGSGPKFQGVEEEVKYPSGAYASKWKDFEKQEISNGGGEQDTILDSVTGLQCAYYKVSDSEKYLLNTMGGENYQIDETTVDIQNSKRAVLNEKEGYYTIELAFSKSASSFARPDGRLYKNLVDQASRFAAGALVRDINNTGVLKVKDVFYTDLSYKVEIWKNGLIKKIYREETVEMYANVDLLVYKRQGAGVAKNNSVIVYSYSSKDYEMQTYIDMFDFYDNIK